MTPNLKFEGLLVSRDVQVLKGMSRIMEDLSIDVDVCMLSSRANDLLTKRDVDLLVVDCDEDGSTDVLTTIRNTVGRRTTIAAIVDPGIAEDLAIKAGAHGVVHKPLSNVSKAEFHCHVYHRMVAERRQERRYAVRWLVTAVDHDDNPVPVTMTDISEAGIGLSFNGMLFPADVLKFRVLLPRTNQIIRFDVRVVWTQYDKIAGAEFVTISTAHANALRKWLQERYSGEAGRSTQGGQLCQ